MTFSLIIALSAHIAMAETPYTLSGTIVDAVKSNDSEQLDVLFSDEIYLSRNFSKDKKAIVARELIELFRNCIPEEARDRIDVVSGGIRGEIKRTSVIHWRCPKVLVEENAPKMTWDEYLKSERGVCDDPGYHMQASQIGDKKLIVYFGERTMWAHDRCERAPLPLE